MKRKKIRIGDVKNLDIDIESAEEIATILSSQRGKDWEFLKMTINMYNNAAYDAMRYLGVEHRLMYYDFKEMKRKLTDKKYRWKRFVTIKDGYENENTGMVAPVNGEDSEDVITTITTKDNVVTYESSMRFSE